jgi:hypothetical protein
MLPPSSPPVYSVTCGSHLIRVFAGCSQHLDRATSFVVCFRFLSDLWNDCVLASAVLIVGSCGSDFPACTSALLARIPAHHRTRPPGS